MAPTVFFRAGTTWTRDSAQQSVWDVMTEPSADAFFPTIMEVHACAVNADPRNTVMTRQTIKYFLRNSFAPRFTFECAGPTLISTWHQCTGSA